MKNMTIFNDTLARYRQALREYFIARNSNDSKGKHDATKRRRDAYDEAEEKLGKEDFEKWLDEMQKIRNEEFPGRRQISTSLP